MMLERMPAKWESGYKLYEYKLKKAVATLFIEHQLLQKAHVETFLANNTEQGKSLQQNKDEGQQSGTSFGSAFGRVYTEELALKKEAEDLRKAKEAAEKKATKEAKLAAAKLKKEQHAEGFKGRKRAREEAKAEKERLQRELPPKRQRTTATACQNTQPSQQATHCVIKSEPVHFGGIIMQFDHQMQPL